MLVAGAKFGVGPALVRAEGRPGGADYHIWRPGDDTCSVASSITTSHMEFPKTNEGRRICQVIKVKPEALDEYKRVRSSRIPRRAVSRAHVRCTPRCGPRSWTRSARHMSSVCLFVCWHAESGRTIGDNDPRCAARPTSIGDLELTTRLLDPLLCAPEPAGGHNAVCWNRLRGRHGGHQGERGDPPVVEGE